MAESAALRPDAGGLLAGAVPLGAFVALAANDGGFDVTNWLPVALLALAQLLVVFLALSRVLVDLPLSSLLAVGLLAAFAAWSFLSILWADDRGAAWQGANRVLFYAAVFALFAVWPWRRGTAAALLGGLAVGVAAVGVLAFVSVAQSDTPGEHFTGGIFVEPVGYHNATAALFLLPVWPALVLASRRELPVLARAVLWATAVLLAELSVLAQSRGAVVAFAISAVLLFTFVPNRVRALLVLVPCAVAVGLSLPALLDVYREVGGDEHTQAMNDAGKAIALSFVGVFAFGVAYALVDTRVALEPRVSRLASRAVGAAALVAIVAAVAYVMPSNPYERLSNAWDTFRAGYAASTEPSASHFTAGLGTNRYDFWRVALGDFREKPLVGIGADNFAIPYVRERKSDEEPLYPHSLQVQVLSQTGLVGAVLFLAFVAGAVAAVARARLFDPLTRAVAVSAAVSCAYWAAHGSVDWLWEIPPLGAMALAVLGMAAGLARPAPRDRAATRVALALVVPGLVAAASLALPWISAKEMRAAGSTWQRDPGAAFDRIERARALDPLSAEPDLLGGAIASRIGDVARMRTSFERALERTPESWYAELELAVAEALARQEASAALHLDRAERLNPREPVIRLVRRRLARGERIVPAEIDRLFLQRVKDRTR
ncbi:MAG TPA: O-antigen ligase family protein [Gaiellaceae bacterium]|nr:O-antigen ligase family protein [Gaiellaceae bacterium]